MNRCDSAVRYAVIQSIDNTAIEIRKSLMSSVVLTGGNTLFPGVKDALVRRLKSTAGPAVASLHVKAGPQRAWNGIPQQSAWRGGCILASLAAFENELVTEGDYEECGPAIVEKMNILRF